MGWDLDDLDPTYVALQIPYGKSAAGGIINLGTKQMINYAHKYDIAVQYWTINDAEDVKYLTENGADCIMTDYPDMAYEVLKNCRK
jgi:glycerophosphoryl diester phosphodiesterase